MKNEASFCATKIMQQLLSRITEYYTVNLQTVAGPRRPTYDMMILILQIAA